LKFDNDKASTEKEKERMSLLNVKRKTEKEGEPREFKIIRINNNQRASISQKK